MTKKIQIVIFKILLFKNLRKENAKYLHFMRFDNKILNILANF